MARGESAEPRRPHRRWVLAEAFAESWRRWRTAARALPAAAWRRYGLVSGAGFCALLGLSVASALWGSHAAPRWLDEWDRQALRDFLEHAPIGFTTGVLLESGGNLLYLVPLTLLASVTAAWRRLPLTAVGVLAAYWLCRLLVLAGWLTWDRARPRMVADGLAAPGAHSFPSGHAALAAAVFGYLAWLWARASPRRAERILAVVLTIALVVAIVAGRLRIGSHWPSDVVAGLVLGTLWAAILAVAETAAGGVARKFATATKPRPGRG